MAAAASDPVTKKIDAGFNSIASILIKTPDIDPTAEAVLLNLMEKLVAKKKSPAAGSLPYIYALQMDGATFDRTFDGLYVASFYFPPHFSAYFLKEHSSTFTPDAIAKMIANPKSPENLGTARLYFFRMITVLIDFTFTYLLEDNGLPKAKILAPLLQLYKDVNGEDLNPLHVNWFNLFFNWATSSFKGMEWRPDLAYFTKGGKMVLFPAHSPDDLLRQPRPPTKAEAIKKFADIISAPSFERFFNIPEGFRASLAFCHEPALFDPIFQEIEHTLRTAYATAERSAAPSDHYDLFFAGLTSLYSLLDEGKQVPYLVGKIASPLLQKIFTSMSEILKSQRLDKDFAHEFHAACFQLIQVYTTIFVRPEFTTADIPTYLKKFIACLKTFGMSDANIITCADDFLFGLVMRSKGPLDPSIIAGFEPPALRAKINEFVGQVQNVSFLIKMPAFSNIPFIEDNKALMPNMIGYCIFCLSLKSFLDLLQAFFKAKSFDLTYGVEEISRDCLCIINLKNVKAEGAAKFLQLGIALELEYEAQTGGSIQIKKINLTGKEASIALLSDLLHDLSGSSTTFTNLDALDCAAFDFLFLNSLSTLKGPSALTYPLIKAMFTALLNNNLTELEAIPLNPDFKGKLTASLIACHAALQRFEDKQIPKDAGAGAAAAAGEDRGFSSHEDRMFVRHLKYLISQIKSYEPMFGTDKDKINILLYNLGNYLDKLEAKTATPEDKVAVTAGMEKTRPVADTHTANPFPAFRHSSLESAATRQRSSAAIESGAASYHRGTTDTDAALKTLETLEALDALLSSPRPDGEPAGYTGGGAGGGGAAGAAAAAAAAATRPPRHRLSDRYSLPATAAAFQAARAAAAASTGKKSLDGVEPA